MKKFLSLLLVSIMILSFGIVANASDTGVTISLEVSEPKEAYGMTYYEVAVKMDKFYTDEASLEAGYNAIQIDIEADDAEKGKFYAMTTAGDLKYSVPEKNPFTGEIMSWSASANASVKASALNSGATGRLVNQAANMGEEVIIQNSFTTGNSLGAIWFVPTAGVTGKINFTIKNVECAAINVTHKTEDFSYDYTKAVIDLGGEEEPDEPIVPDEPVATTVKTFAKRLYVDNTLYTVGVISEGTNYATEVIKAGINIEKGDATVNYWAADDAIISNEAGTSYYVVGLKDVKDTTDITVNSKSKAIITVNGGEIIDADDAIGAEKTDLEVPAE